MSEEIQKAPERGLVEYVPYGNQDKIKMSVSIVQNLIAVKTKSGKTCSDRDAIKFLAMCQAKRLNPFEGDAFLVGYDGKDGPQFALITAHQTYLKRAELHPEFDGMKSGIIVRHGDTLKDLEGDFFEDGQVVVGGWATVFFKNRKQPMCKRLRLERFRKPFGIWLEDPAGMICKCAEADALRSAFPTMLGGLYMREEVEVLPQLTVSKPDFSASKPIFEVPANGGAEKQISGSAEPEVRETPQSPEGRPPESEPASQGASAFNPVKALRGLCQSAKIPEPMMLRFLTELGSIEPGMHTLEELAIKASKILDLAVSQFADISQKINDARAQGWPEKQPYP